MTLLPPGAVEGKLVSEYAGKERRVDEEYKPSNVTIYTTTCIKHALFEFIYRSSNLTLHIIYNQCDIERSTI
jgi:hypothetical protein